MMKTDEKTIAMQMADNVAELEKIKTQEEFVNWTAHQVLWEASQSDMEVSAKDILWDIRPTIEAALEDRYERCKISPDLRDKLKTTIDALELKTAKEIVRDNEKIHYRNIALILKHEAESFLAANHLTEFTFSIEVNLTERRFEVIYHVGRSESLHLNFSSLTEENKRLLVAHLDQHLRDWDEATGPSRNSQEFAEYYSTRMTADEWFGEEIPAKEIRRKIEDEVK